MNFLALCVDADEAWALARKDGRVLPVGKNLVVHFAEYWKLEAAREDAAEKGARA